MSIKKSWLGLTWAMALVLGLGACADNNNVPPEEDIKKTCTKSAECASGEVCSAGLCIIGDCVVRTDCPHPGDQLCSLNKCVPDPDSPIGNECPNGDQDCDMGEFCSAGTCYNVSSSTPCSRSSDCSAGERCDPVNGFCVEDRGGCNRADEYPELDCPEGDVCDALTGQCNPPSGIPCTEATELEDCGEGMSCISNRCVQCNANSNCDAEGALCCAGSGTQCNVATGRCVSAFICSSDQDCTDCLLRPGMDEQTYCSNGSACNSDSDCSSVSDRRCSTATGECIQPECVDDGDCSSGHDSRWSCDAVTWHCYLPPADCAESNEPNDTVADAISFEGTEYSDLLCRGDTDVIAVPGVANQRLRVNVSLSTSGSDISVRLLDSHGQEMDSADFGYYDDTTRVSADVGAAETFYVQLVGQDSTYDAYNYTLNVEYLEPLQCDSEPGEPNDTVALSSNSVLTAGVHNLALCGLDDEDYHQIVAVANMRTIVEVNSLYSEGNIDAELWTLDGSSMLDSSTNYENDEELRYSGGATDSTLLVWVGHSQWSSGEDEQEYTITIKSEELPDCQDGYEPNENETQAALITSGDYEGTICDIDDRDWFAINMPAGGALTARTSFTDSDGDLELRLHKTGGDTIDSSASSSDNEEVSGTNLSPGMYFVEVYPFSGTSTDRQPYRLEIVAEHQCLDDELGAGTNNRIENAVALRDDALTSFLFDEDLKLCSSNDDWYRVLLLGDEVLDLQATGPEGLFAELYTVDETGEVMVAAAVQSHPFAGETQLDLHFPVPGRGALYYLRVGGGGDLERSYHLSVMTDLDSCPEDSLEYNDALMMATPIQAPAQVFSASVCPSTDTDSFSLPVLSGTVVHLLLDFDGSIADLDLQALIDQEVVASATVVHNAPGAIEQLDYTAQADGDLYLRVLRHAGDLGETVDYQLSVDVEGGVLVDAGMSDAADIDAESLDAELVDAGPVDAAAVADAETLDAAAVDAIVDDAAPVDAQVLDAGVVDAELADTFGTDTAVDDAAIDDAAVTDTAIEDAANQDALADDAADAAQPDAA